MCGAVLCVHMEITMDFAFLTAVGPVLALTVICFLLAFVAEFVTDGETLSDSILKDDGAQRI